MNYSYVPPPLPSLVRWRSIYKSRKKISCLRALEYERLAALKISGPVLDVGGGQKSLYRNLIPNNISYDSINIDHGIEPTHLISAGMAFPIEDNKYPTCLCLNTLEHIYDARFVIDEIFRVLTPGGVVHITVPFVFRIHGHPDDYFRGTPSWWRETMSRAGFSHVELQPLIWGRYTSGGSISGYHGLFHLTHLADIIYAKFAFAGNDGRYSGRRGERICNTALGWFISAKK